MPSPRQVVRLRALEAQHPATQQELWSPACIRAAVQDLLAAIDGGYDENDTLHRWAWSASDEELTAWWGSGPRHQPAP